MNVMDPTFARQLREFLQSDEARDTVADADALLELVPDPMANLEPHLVHVAPTYEDEDRTFYEEVDGKEVAHRKIEKKVRRQIVVDCPDCRLGLTPIGTLMICPRLPQSIDLPDTKRGHEGCVIACGLKS